MLFFAREWGGASWASPERASASLGLFTGGPANSDSTAFESAGSNPAGRDHFAFLDSPRARARRGWRVARSPAGWPVLLSGWIDNLESLRAELGIADGPPERTYGAAVERWGDDAERRVIGSYAAVVCLPDGTLRLSRSPWTAPPLFFHVSPEAILCASIPRPLFAAGLEKRLRPHAIDLLLAMEIPEPDRAVFEGVETLRFGTVLHLGRDGRRENRWYDPRAIAPVPRGSVQDHVAEAARLLGKASGAALALAQRPAMALSGGLDSGIVCDELLRHLPEGRRLDSFTFEPLAGWSGQVAPHKFPSDRPWVEAYAAMHPRLDAHFVDNAGIAWDDRADQMFLACDAGYPARVAGTVYHGLFDAARNRGCDWLLTADGGNATFSSTAPWAWTEFLRTGQWRQLWKLAAARPRDPRPVAQRVVAHAVMPLLPAGLRRGIRALRHSRAELDRGTNPLLRDDGRLAAFRRRENVHRNIGLVDETTSRADYIAALYDALDPAGEVALGYEQVFGIRTRDVTAYRPLMEFCFGLPTAAFVHDGQSRLLARQLGIGRMPEAQRTNPLYGDMNVDWHMRLTPRLADLRRQVERIRSHPQLGEVIDAARAEALIAGWPRQAPGPEAHLLVDELRFFLPATAYVARYVDFIEGRNAA